MKNKKGNEKEKRYKVVVSDDLVVLGVFKTLNGAKRKIKEIVKIMKKYKTPNKTCFLKLQIIDIFVDCRWNKIKECWYWDTSKVYYVEEVRE